MENYLVHVCSSYNDNDYHCVCVLDKLLTIKLKLLQLKGFTHLSTSFDFKLADHSGETCP